MSTEPQPPAAASPDSGTAPPAAHTTPSEACNTSAAVAASAAPAAAATSSPAAAACASPACGDSPEATAPAPVSPSCAVSTENPTSASPPSSAVSPADAGGGPAVSSTASKPSARPVSSVGAGARVSAQGGERQGSVAWSVDVENALLEACLSTLNYSACRDLERRVRSGSGTEDRARQAPCCPTPDAADACAGHSHHAHHVGSCCEQNCKSNGCSTGSGATACTDSRTPRPLPYKFMKDRDDHLGELLDSWLSPSRLRDLLGNIAERAAKVFANVVNRGKADGMDPPTGAEEKQLRLEILKEATIREVQLRILEEVNEERKLDSREGGMLANPLAYKQGHLSHLLPETIAALMKEGVAVQRAFLGEKVRKMILREIELLEYDGRFNEVFQQSLSPLRKDYMCWATLSDLDREKQQGLWQLFQTMQALPYELNKKAHLCLQVSWVFQLAVYPADGSYYRRHMDAGFAPGLDNGRKITAVYYPNAPDWQPSDGGYLRVYDRWRRKEQLAMAPGDVAPYEAATNFLREIEPAGDTLVLLRSREMPHEVLETHRKRFAITLWISGPPGPGDDL